MKLRQSNFELMRIVSMFMIIIWHVFLYGVDLSSATPYLKLFFEFFESIIVVHVNSFVLVSGFFLVNSSFKMSKLLQLNNSVVFYKICFFIIFTFLGIAEVNCTTIFRNLFPIDLENYWFIRIYMIMYIFSPFYNRFINNISQQEHKRIIIVMLFLFSFLSTITNQEALLSYTVSYGYSIVSFTFLYFIGAYLRKYPIDNMYLGKRYSKNAKQLFFIIMFFILAIINYSFHISSKQFVQYDGFLRYIGNIIYTGFNKYDNPIVVFQSISYFMIFYYMNFSSKFINSISKTVFGIYLIHENIFMRNNMYRLFKFPAILMSKKIFIHIFAAALIIFISCSIVELLRQIIFRFIYNLKISILWRKKYRNYFEKLGFKINW